MTWRQGYLPPNTMVAASTDQHGKLSDNPALPDDDVAPLSVKGALQPQRYSIGEKSIALAPLVEKFLTLVGPSTFGANNAMNRTLHVEGRSARRVM